MKLPFAKPAAHRRRSHMSLKAAESRTKTIERSKLIPELLERGTFQHELPSDADLLKELDRIEAAEKSAAVRTTPKGSHGGKGVQAAAAVFGQGRLDRDAIPPPSAVRLWQQEAWGFYDLVGELGYSIDFYANCFSRVDLVPGLENEDGTVQTTFDDEAPEQSDIGNIASLIKDLKPSHGGLTGLNSTAGANLALAGEGFLYLNDEKDWNPGTWEFLSTDELRPISGGGGSSSKVTWVRYYGPGFYPRRLDETSYIVRCWSPHPRFSRHAQSSIKRLLPILDELVLLTREVRGETVSRLVNNGLVLMPDELSFTNDEEGDQGSEEQDPFTRDFIEWCMKPITDKDSAAGVVPMTIVGPAEYLQHIRYVSFARPDAAVAMAKRREAVERFAQGVDLPPEIVLGHMNTTFANAEQITEDLFRTHIEPKLLVWCECLTVGYLWPALMKAAGIGPNPDGTMPEIPPEIRKQHIWYDASKLVAHPDRSKNASEAHAAMVLSDESYLRALGFTVDDLPGPDEVAMRIRMAQALNIRETIRAQDTNVLPFMDPNLLRPQVQPGFPQDGVTLPDPGLARLLEQQKEALGVQPAPGTKGGPALPAPVLPGQPPAPAPAPGAPPAPAPVQASARHVVYSGESYGIGVLALRIFAAAEITVDRATERAANRLRGEARRTPTFAMVLDGVAPAEIARTLGPQAVADIGIEKLFAGEFAPFTRAVTAWAREHGSASPGTLAERVTATVQEMARRRLFDPDFRVELAYFAQHVEDVGWTRPGRWSNEQPSAPELTTGQP